MRKTPRWLITGCLLGGIGTLPAHAESEADRPLWEAGLGVGVLQLPHYRGSDQSHTWVLPVPYLVYRGQILKADREGARAVLLDADRLKFDLSVGASAPARSHHDEARDGMDDLPPTVELGPNLNYTLARDTRWKLDLRLPVRGAISVEKHPDLIGWLATPNLNLGVAAPHGWNAGLQAALVFADRRYHAHFYDVPDEDARPGRPAYRASGGFGGGQLTASLSRRFENHWVGAFVRFDTLRGATFLDSPLVRDRQQWSAGIAYSWIFAKSTRMVRSAD